jgi:hypothetical protein
MHWQLQTPSGGQTPLRGSYSLHTSCPIHRWNLNLQAACVDDELELEVLHSR